MNKEPFAQVRDQRALERYLEESESMEYSSQGSTSALALPQSSCNVDFGAATDKIDLQTLLVERQRQSHKKIKTVIEKTEGNQRSLAALEGKLCEMQRCIDDLQRGQGLLRAQQTQILDSIEQRQQTAAAYADRSTSLADRTSRKASGLKSCSCLCVPWTALVQYFRQQSRKDYKSTDDAGSGLLPIGKGRQSHDAAYDVDQENMHADNSFMSAVEMERGNAPVRRCVHAAASSD